MRNPLKTSGLSGRELLKRTYHEFSEDEVPVYASALAYHAILALFPFLLFLLGLSSMLGIEAVFDRLLGWGRTVLPPQGFDQVREVVAHFRDTDAAGLLSVGILGALWAASGGVRSAMNALNQAYDVEEARSWWKRYLLSVAYTLAIGGLLLIAMLLMLVGPQIVDWLAGQVGLTDVVAEVWRWLRYPVAVLLLMLATAVAYTVLPNRGRFKFMSPGAVVAVILWIIISLALQLYLANFGRYNVLYGSIGAVIVLLLYLWLTSMAILLGGEINAVLLHAREEHEAAGREPAKEV